MEGPGHQVHSLGTLHHGGTILENVELRTQGLGFDPAARGSLDWDGCLVLPPSLRSTYGDDKFCFDEVLYQPYDAASLRKMSAKYIKPNDLAHIRFVVAPHDFTKKGADRLREVYFHYEFSKIL